MLNAIRGTPPLGKMVGMKVIRVTEREPCNFICVSKAAFGQPIHWYGNRSHECTSERGHCENCQKNWPRKWKAYLHVMGHESKFQAFLEITETCFDQIVALMPDRQSFRGSIIRLGRTKGGKKGRYTIDVLDRVIPDGNLPNEIDPLPTLRYLWNAGK